MFFVRPYLYELSYSIKQVIEYSHCLEYPLNKFLFMADEFVVNFGPRAVRYPWAKYHVSRKGPFIAISRARIFLSKGITVGIPNLFRL